MSATARVSDRVDADNYPTPAWCVRRLLEAVNLPLQAWHDGAGDDSPEASRSARWLEPCVGEGAIVVAANDFCAGQHGMLPTWHLNDTRSTPVLAHALERKGSECTGSLGDYLARPFPGFDVIITNPPFSAAFSMARKAVREAPHVALLLRLNWLASGIEDGRCEWLRANAPDVYVLPNRPSFVASLKCKGLPASKRLARDAREACGWQRTITMLEHRARIERRDIVRCPDCDGHVACTTSDATDYAWFVWTPERNRVAGSLRVLAPTPEDERRAG